MRAPGVYPTRRERPNCFRGPPTTTTTLSLSLSLCLRLLPALAQAVILFTHLRRCGGTFLEDSVLKPIARRPSVDVRSDGFVEHRPSICAEPAE